MSCCTLCASSALPRTLNMDVDLWMVRLSRLTMEEYRLPSSELGIEVRWWSTLRRHLRAFAADESSRINLLRQLE